jgi:WD40 repeat protein
MSMSHGTREYGRFDELAEEFVERYRRGERPNLQEYIDRLPELADEIRELFPALAQVEQAEEDARGEASPPPIAAPPLGRIGDYRIVREIGRGGMGVVYEAEQVSLGRRVALKVLPHQVAHDPRALERFRREARAAARLHHTNIVPVFEVGRDGEVAYYAMQFIQGQGLDQVIDELARLRDPARNPGGAEGPGPSAAAGPGPWGPAPGRIVESLLGGWFATGGAAPSGDVPPTTVTGPAAAGRSAGDASRTSEFVPSDPGPARAGPTEAPRPSAVLPGGIPVSTAQLSGRRAPFFRGVAQIGRQAAQGLAYAHASGIVHRDIKPSNLLLDHAGVVWIADFGLAKTDEEGLTHTGDILGTLRYLAPERFRGEGDARADIYALGLTLYELLTLRPGFDTTDRLRLIERIKAEEPMRPRAIDVRIPRDLETIVLKAIEKDPAARYPSAEAMAEDLRRFLADEPIRARRASAAERGARWARHHPGMATLGAVLTAVLVMATVASLIAASRFRQQWLRAELKTLEANEKTLEANQKTRALERQLYINRISLAQREALTNIYGAEQLLDQCPPALRGWEWNYVRRSCHLERRTLKSHTRSVNTVAFSPDGRLLLSGAGERYYGAEVTHDAELTLWDARSGQRLRGLAGLKGGVNSAAFSPDGRFVAVGSGYHRGDQPAEGHLSVWEVVTGRLLYDRVESGMNLLSVAFSPDGRLIATGHGVYSSKEPGRLKLWDARRGTEVHTIEAPPGGVNSVAFSADGRRLALACSGVIELWQVDPLRKEFELRGHTSWVYAVAFSPDGTRLASGGWDKTIRIWDTARGTLVLTGEGHISDVCAVVFSPDGKRVASGGGEHILWIWDAATGHALRTLRGHTRGIGGLAYSPDGSTIATGGDDALVKLWDATAEDPIALRGHQGWVTSVAFSPDGRRILSASGDHALMLWDSMTGRRLQTLEKHGEWVQAAAFSPDGRLIASAALDQALLLWDAATLRVVKTLSTAPRYPKCLAFSPGGDLLAIGTATAFNSPDQAGIVRVWEIASGRELPTYRGHAGGVLHLAFSPDGKAVASVGGDPRRAIGEARLWDPRTAREIRTFEGHADCIKAVAFSPDGRLLATGSQDGTVKLWDPGTGRLHRNLGGLTGGVESLAFSPDGARLATGRLADEAVKLWDVAAGDEVLALRGGHASEVVSLAFSPDGGRLVSGGIDWTARVWDARPLDQTEESSLIADHGPRWHLETIK